MTDKEKLELLRDQLIRIQDLTPYRLEAYAQQVNLSTWPDDVKKWLMKAVDVRAEEVLSDVHDFMVVQEELTEIA